MSGARPGWYPDPRDDQGCFRWWNGTEWTTAVAESAHAPQPARARAVRPPGLSRSIGGMRWSGRIRAPWTLGFALVAVAGVVLGLVIWHDPSGPSPSAAAGVTPGPSASGVRGELDRSSREASIGEASMTLPDDPYELRADPMRAKDLFDSYFAAGATVHEDYRGGRDWAAIVGLAHVGQRATRVELDATAVTVGQQVAATFFDGQPTTVESASVAEHSVDGCPGYLFTASVRYRIAGLASSTDELTVLVVRLDDGTRVAAFSSVPTDAPAALRAQAASSLESIRIG